MDISAWAETSWEGVFKIEDSSFKEGHRFQGNGKARGPQITRIAQMGGIGRISLIGRIGRSFGLGGGDVFEEALDDGVDADAFGFGAVVEEDAVAEDRKGEGADVLDGDVGAALEDGSGLGTEDEALRGTGAGTPGDGLVDEIGSARVALLIFLCVKMRAPKIRPKKVEIPS